MGLERKVILNGVVCYITPDGRVFNDKMGELKLQTYPSGYKYVACKKKHFLVHRIVAMALAWIVCGAVTALAVLVLVDERKKHKPLDAVPYALIVLAGPLVPAFAFCFASAYFVMSFLLSLAFGDPK